MLTARVLAAHDLATAVVTPSRKRPRDESETQSVASSEASSVPVGKVRAIHAASTMKKVSSIEKWVLAALAHLGATLEDVVLESKEPNVELNRNVVCLGRDWFVARKTAKEVGATCKRACDEASHPPTEVCVLMKQYLLAHINARRAPLPIVHEICRDFDSISSCKDVREEVDRQNAASGNLFHQKRDLTPSPEELTTMFRVAFTADARVDASDLLAALETGMAQTLYLHTFARAYELKKLQMQSIGTKVLRHERSGSSFRVFELTVHQTKTKSEHLNQMLASSNPWDCPVGALGMSMLLRMRRRGLPPIRMELDDESWRVMGSDVGASFETRTHRLFALAGLRRQKGDPLFNLGRHFGTRKLSHQGGTDAGNKKMKGHASGNPGTYSEVPLPDLLRVMGNDPDAPFEPAHLSVVESDDGAAARAARALIPGLRTEREALARRMAEVDAMPVQRGIQVRSEEHHAQRLRMLDAIEYACRVALACLVARPRSWKKWAIRTEEPTLWETRSSNALLAFLFADRAEAVGLMDALATQVRAREDVELARPCTSAVTTEFMTEVVEQQREFMSEVVKQIRETSPPTVPGEAKPEAVAPKVLADPLPTVRVHHAYRSQSDVVHYTTHASLAAALAYAREVLAPRERAHGHAWRVTKDASGRRDNSRDRQWGFYKQLAIAVGRIMEEGNTTEEAALAALQARQDAAPSATAFNKQLYREQSALSPLAREIIAHRVLGY